MIQIDKIKEEWEIKLKSMLWDIGHTTEDAQNIIDFFSQTISEAISQHNEKIKEMVKNKKATCLGNPEWMLSIEDRIKNETLDDIITNLTQDTNPKE